MIKCLGFLCVLYNGEEVLSLHCYCPAPIIAPFIQYFGFWADTQKILGFLYLWFATLLPCYPPIIAPLRHVTFLQPQASLCLSAVNSDRSSSYRFHTTFGTKLSQSRQIYCYETCPWKVANIVFMKYAPARLYDNHAWNIPLESSKLDIYEIYSTQKR